MVGWSVGLVPCRFLSDVVVRQFEESTEVSSSFLRQSDEVNLILDVGEVTMMAFESANVGVFLWVGEILRNCFMACVRD